MDERGPYQRCNQSPSSYYACHFITIGLKLFECCILRSKWPHRRQHIPVFCSMGWLKNHLHVFLSKEVSFHVFVVADETARSMSTTGPQGWSVLATPHWSKQASYALGCVEQQGKEVRALLFLLMHSDHPKTKLPPTKLRKKTQNRTWFFHVNKPYKLQRKHNKQHQ